MQTRLTEEMRQNARALEADSILRACVHCGFCTATCPTYQLLGDELDGPRGRIYLIKQVLEGNDVTLKTQEHLDRCLTCRNCETTCPSGVRYHNLLDIGRDIVDFSQRNAPPQSISCSPGKSIIGASLGNEMRHKVPGNEKNGSCCSRNCCQN